MTASFEQDIFIETMKKLKKTQQIDNTDNEKTNKPTQIIGNSVAFMHDLCCTRCGTGIVLKAADAEAERRGTEMRRSWQLLQGPFGLGWQAGRAGGMGCFKDVLKYMLHNDLTLQKV